jgi:hypothetical protein
MQTEPVTFHSDGLKLGGAFFLPDEFDGATPQPLVISCSGFTGLMNIHPARFARFLTARGRLCFGFDYRGFGGSEGERRRVILDEQVRDIISAVSFAEADPRIDRDRVILLGWGMGAGLVIDAARELLGVVGLVLLNGFYCGKRVQLAHRGPTEYLAFRDMIREQYSRRAHGESPDQADPFHFYPLDPQSREHVDKVLRTHEGYDTQLYSAEMADSLLRWNPEAYAPHMRTPMLVAHGTRNALHPYTEAEHLFSAWGGPKQIHWIQGAGHTEWMLDDHPHFQALGRRIDAWLTQLLASP